ncbi:hypothetical protein BDW02DRAFT_618103 [Decorospora gaudefroyi]|uniref:RBR-type E3 ubiquitin transferase n=1 Tax=Decorospora gaudefroyi TaxID=184978 RepID=A0A6A5KUP2_9PLEO|nr:hypothetical protein BDW02DRAFT_618103 [Decorospora gaudefroyi]
MAPSTRLRARPDRRVNYTDTADRTDTLEDPARLEITREPTARARKVARKPPTRTGAGRVKEPSKTPEPSSAIRKSTPNPAVRVTDGAIVKPEPKSIPKAPKAKKQECSICATTKTISRAFKVPKDACEHFLSICNLCIQKMLRMKVVQRQFAGAELPCPIPDCGHVLDYPALDTTVSKAAFDEYDKAITKHALTAGENYIACLSPDCGLYFSIEDCKRNTRVKQIVACPYCEYETCLTCDRPGKSHGKGSCDKAKQAEEAETDLTLKIMGVKPCPECGINIKKEGGCDHMTCQACHHNFCWICLVQFFGSVPHLDTCPHRGAQLAADPGNWAADGLTEAQMNNMIREARDRLNNAEPQ